MRCSRLLPPALALAAACTSDSSVTGNQNGNGSITISIATATLDVTQGASGSVNITIARAGGFDGAVTLGLSGAPSGVTGAFQPATVGSGASAAMLTVTVDASAAPGAYTLTVQASGQGVASVTATLTLNVTAAPQPDLSISLSSSAIQLAPGDQYAVNVDIQRVNGFTGAVSLSVSGAPLGLTVSFNPANVTGNSAVATVSAAIGLPPGTYDLTIQADATGLPQKTAQLSVTVDNGGGGGGSSGSITWRFCPAYAIPVWFAYQGGSGPWTQVQSGTLEYSFSLGSGRGGVAFTIVDGADALTTMYFGTASELEAIGMLLCRTTSDVLRTVQGTVAGLGALDQAYVTLGTAAEIVPTGTSSFTLQGVPPGPQDLIAGRASLTITGGTPGYELNKLIMRTNQDPADGTTLPVLDFNSAEAFAPVARTVTIQNLGGDAASILTGYVTNNGPTGDYHFDFLPNNASVRTWYAIPGARQQPSDLHVLTVQTSPGAGGSFATRSAARYFDTAVDQTLELGPPLGLVTHEVVTSFPYSRSRVQYTPQPEYDRNFLVVLGGDPGTGGRSFLINVTAGWLNGATKLDITTPDFSSTSGWNNGWGVPVGVQCSWTLRASGWTGAGVVAAPRVNGTETKGALRGDLYTC